LRTYTPFPEELWGRKVCGIVWCYTGPHDRAEAVLEPVTTFGSPLLVGLAPMPFSMLQSAFDPLYPARAAMVLAGGLLQRDLRHRDRRAP
jgi:hypothetical protein